MSKRDDVEFLADIKEAIRRINFYTKHLDFAAFLDDLKTQDAVVRNLEVIGEATKNLSEQVRLNNPQIPWKSLAGVRDKLVHHYFGVSFSIVWNIIKQELPSLLDQLDNLNLSS